MAERRPGEYSDGAPSHDGGGRQVSDGGSEEVKRAERLRLATLREYRIMDTPPEAAFDRVTKMVADLYRVPIALVSLVDADREWFKSTHALGRSEKHTSNIQSIMRNSYDVIYLKKKKKQLNYK